jgi:5S rRNA maturation endonuclease (ribonuclease M5)
MIDYVSSSNRVQFVIDQLNTYSGVKKTITGSTFILCPYHAEKTPSGRIFHGRSVFFKCYGCGATAKWDELAPKLGLKPFKRLKPQDEYARPLILETETVTSGFVNEDLVFSELPANKLWRSIKTNLLIEIGAKKCQVKHPEYGLLRPKVWLPCYIRGQLEGYIKAQLRKDPNYPSYINAKGQWSKTRGLFPFDKAVSMARELGISALVLVEGPRDALRLVQYGIPAVCILGTQSWTATKNKLLELAGIEKLIIMMDGDCAGIEATEMLVGQTTNMFDLVVLKLWDMKGSPYRKFAHKKEPTKAAKRAGVSLWDPGNAPERILEKIKTKYFGGQ